MKFYLLAAVHNEDSMQILADISSKMNEQNPLLKRRTVIVVIKTPQCFPHLFRRNICIVSILWKTMLLNAFLLQNGSWIKIISILKKKYRKNLSGIYLFQHYFPTAKQKALDDFKCILNVLSVNRKQPILNSAKHGFLSVSISYNEL